jgi:septum site-determining protein MinC
MANALCELKSGQFQLMRLAIYRLDPHAIQAFVADQVSQAPQLFEFAPVAIDLSALVVAPDADTLDDLAQRLRYAGVNPIAVVAEADSPLAIAAHALKLGVVAVGKRQKSTAETRAEAPTVQRRIPDELLAEAKKLEAERVAVANATTQPNPSKPAKSAEPIALEKVAEARNPTPVERPATQIYDGPIRSGQQLYARAKDLVITGSVGAGAEVMADGNVHVYGRLIGKVIAGAQGDRSARIFAQVFGAELVAIAGVFRVLESIPADLRGQSVQIFLDGEKLKIEPLGH